VDEEVYGLFKEEVNDLRGRGLYAQFEHLDIYKREGEDSKHVTFRLNIASNERTLTDPEVNKLLDAVAAAAKERFGAERV
jgi:phenylalanyl-tRNA synthetase beta subunit